MEKEEKKRLQKLEIERNILNTRINKIIEIEENKVAIPKCHALVGVCLKSEFKGDYSYAKLIELVDTPKYGLYFLMERFYITKEGSVYFMTDTCFPYTNKEWWEADIPIHGWKRITEKEYQAEKERAKQEFSSMNKLRKFINKRS